MAEKDVLKEKAVEEWKVQFTRNKGGVMINARGNSAEEAFTCFSEAVSLYDNAQEEEKEEAVQLEVPFYDDGTEPYTKRDGSVGYEIAKGSVPRICQVCKKEVDFEIVSGRFGKYWQDSEGHIVRVKKEK